MGASSFLPNTASAQVGIRLTAQSDYRLRGNSISERRPVLIADIEAEAGGGIYLNGSLAGAITGSGPRVMGAIANVGYAWRLDTRSALDIGVLHSEYPGSPDTEYYGGYTEVYVGLARAPFLARISYSPDYFQTGEHAVYGEVEASVSPLRRWTASAHLGGFLYINSDPTEQEPVRYDWRVSVSRAIGTVELFGALSGGGPGEDVYAGRPHPRTALVVGITHRF